MRGSYEFLFSCEGVTQGDPLSMFLYAVGTLPLIQSLKKPTAWTQVWYILMMLQLVGNFNPSVSGLIYFFSVVLPLGTSQSCVVVDPSAVASAEQVFGPLGVSVVMSHRFLGGFLGDVTARHLFVQGKVSQWAADVYHLSQIAIHQLQAAYAALTKCLQCE